MSIPVDKEGVLEIAVQNNQLLAALAEHPKFNKKNPDRSPKPLWYTADFVRRTYLEYIMPLLPRDAQNKSSKIANRAIFPYSPLVPGDCPPFPDSENEAWLMDNKNWPKNRNKQAKELYSDAIGRTMMIALALNDKVKGAMMLGGEFDWDANPRIMEIVAEILSDKD